MSVFKRVSNVLRGKWALQSSESKLEAELMSQALERELERDRSEPGAAAHAALERLKAERGGAEHTPPPSQDEDPSPPVKRTL